MPVDPQCQAVLDAMADADGPTVFDTRDPAEARRKSFNEHNHLFNDRRPEFYEALTIRGPVPV